MMDYTSLEDIHLIDTPFVKETILLSKDDLQRLTREKGDYFQKGGAGVPNTYVTHGNRRSFRESGEVVDLHDEENGEMVRAFNRFRGLGKANLLAAIHRFNKLKVYLKNLDKGVDNREQLSAGDVVKEMRVIITKYGREMAGVGVVVTDLTNILPSMERIVDRAVMDGLSHQLQALIQIQTAIRDLNAQKEAAVYPSSPPPNYPGSAQSTPKSTIEIEKRLMQLKQRSRDLESVLKGERSAKSFTEKWNPKVSSSTEKGKDWVVKTGSIDDEEWMAGDFTQDGKGDVESSLPPIPIFNKKWRQV